jgi:hypothetical protein
MRQFPEYWLYRPTKNFEDSIRGNKGEPFLNLFERRPTMRLSRHMFDDVHKEAVIVPESPSTDYEMSRPPFEDKDFELDQEETKGEDTSERERRTEMITFEDSSL